MANSTPKYPTVLSKFWPRTLKLQFALFISLLLAASMLIFTLRALHDEVEHITSNMKLQAKVLANNLAATGADNLLRRDYTAIEQLLFRSIDFPGVQAIQISDTTGKLLGDVVRINNEEAEARYGRPPLKLPATAEASIYFMTDKMIIWQPIVLGDLLGWVRITYSLDDIAAAEQRVLRNNIIMGAIIILLALVSLIFYLRRTTQTVERYTTFADSLNETQGEQIAVSESSVELEHLGKALNGTSMRLHEQKLAIKTVMAELERLAAFPEMNPNIVLSMNKKGEVQYLNPHGEMMLAKLELQQSHMSLMLPNNYKDIINRCLHDDETVHAVESNFRGYSFLWTFAPVSSQELVHGYALEITQRKQAEEKAREAQIEKSAAEAANKSKSAFLANMSHEMRTPLTAIIGFSESLLDEQQSNEQRQDATQTVIRAGRHLLQIINDILDLSKVEAEKLEIEMLPVPIFNVVSDIKSIATMQAEAKGVLFNVEYVFPLPMQIQSDPVRIKQILLNLVNNALKFTEKGTVTLRVKYLYDNHKIQFEVIDTGIGIEAEKVEQLFQPFKQADASTTRKYGGTGLGLYLSKLLSEKLGGSISVTSTRNQGSCFTCTIDIGDISELELVNKTPDLMQFEAISNTGNVQSLAGEVLVVEDNEDNQKLIRLYLRKLGLNVTIAENGAFGVEAALRKDFDLVLMDMQMPVMDGLEATMTLRDKGYTLPIIALTASAMRSDIQRCQEAGCNDFLSKPIEHERFNNVIRHYIKQSPNMANKKGRIVSELLEDDESMADLVEMYLERLPGILEDISGLAAEKNWAELQKKIHDLKGVSGGYGFPLLSEVTSTLEDALKQQAYTVVAGLLDDIHGVAQRMLQASNNPANNFKIVK